MMVIVPDSVSEAINRKLDHALLEVPEAAPDREMFYTTLLNYFNEHGVIPDFQLAKRHDAAKSPSSITKE